MKFNFLDALFIKENKNNYKMYFIQKLCKHSSIVAYIDYQTNKVIEKVVTDDMLSKLKNEMISYHEQEKILRYFNGTDFGLENNANLKIQQQRRKYL